MISTNAEESYTMWQTKDNGEGVAEPAITINNYSVSETISLESENGFLQINYENVEELCKHLRKLVRASRKANF